MDCHSNNAKTKSTGKEVYEYVNNFHIHQGEQETKCTTCGEEKVCLRCAGPQFCSYMCDICHVQFPSRITLTRHQKSKHSPASSSVIPCPECSEEFLTLGEYFEHKSVVHAKEVKSETSPSRQK